MTIDIDLLSAALPHQIAILDENERYLHVNEAYALRHGLPAAEFVGKKPSEVVDPQQEGKTTRIARPEGGFILVSDDPGDRNRRTNRIQRAEERLQAFVDYAPIGVIFSHLDGRVLDANKAFLESVEYTREDLDTGQIHWDKLTPDEYLHLDYEAIAQAKETGFSYTYEKEYVTKSGKRIHILVGFILVGPTRDEAVAFIVDITAQKHAEEEVRRLNAELEERVAQRTTEIEAANKELEAFCYSVSHDLRAPLRSIDGFAYALFQDYEDKLDSEGLDFINRIRGSAKRMDELISALLSLSRVTRSEVEREDVDGSAMAETISADLKQHTDGSLKILIQPNLTIHADRRMLQVVLDNLLGNAVKFSAKETTPEVAFGYNPGKNAFYVYDNGVGFNVEESEKLFQPFERLHSPREFSGNGIGLATVQRIIRKHGGAIWAESQVGQGATFYFTL